MPVGALCIALFTGWCQQKADVLQHMREGSSAASALPALWLAALRYLAPLAILLVFANTLGWI